MAYSPENNPYIPGDPYSYDLKWIVSEVKRAISLYEPLSTDFQELYDYVHDYFEGADFEALVDNGLAKLATDGTLSELLMPYFNEYKTEIDQEVADLTLYLNTKLDSQDSDISVLQARMDTFASLPSGSTSGNAELLDIRVDNYGVTWDSAGNAVRGEDKTLETIEDQDIEGLDNGKRYFRYTWGSINADGSINYNYVPRSRIVMKDYMKFPTATTLQRTADFTYIVALYNDSFGLISRTLYANAGVINIPANTYFRIAIFNDNIPSPQYVSEFSAALSYTSNIQKIFNNLSNYKPIIALRVGSDQAYTTFTAAFNACTDPDAYDYIIYYYGNGTYIVNTEPGFNETLYTPRGLRKIIGVGDRNKNILYDTSSHVVGGNESVFYINYDCSLENLCFVGNGKYNIHIDDGTNANQEITIKNCKFTHASGGSGNIGIGIHANEIIRIEDCEFAQSTDAGVRIHNWDNVDAMYQHLYVTGCIFKPNMVNAIHLYTVNRYNFMNREYGAAFIEGNEFNGLPIALSEEDYPTYGAGNVWQVWGRNNSPATVNITHHDTANYTDMVTMFLPQATITDTQL